MRITTIPQCLYANRLLTGEHEFFCYLSIPQEAPSADPLEKVTWKVTSAAATLTGTVKVNERQAATGRIPIQVILPTGWQGGQLSVSVHSAKHVSRMAQPISAFTQEDSFRLPLAGMVLVLGGHRIGEVHRAAWQIQSQQFGWDFLPLGADGKLLLTDFSDDIKPQDFVGFGQAVFAPAKGHVVDAIDGQPDLPNVGTLPDLKHYLGNLRNAQGNSVILDHGGGIWSCCGHLRQGSVSVRKGMQVEAGQVIGALGNSGFSSGPHLHFHFMNGPDLLTASPLPVEMEIEGRRYAPQAGEILSN